MGLFSGPGLTPNLKGLATNTIELAAGACWTISPAGWYATKPGPYTSLQQYDPILGIWQNIGAGSTAAPKEYFYSDGVNYRIANQTGCAIGAVITNAGSGYTSAPVVTAGAGSSVWRAIVGGAVNTSVTVSNGGQTYSYPPTVLFSVPPPGGIQATGYCTLSAGAVSSVTVTDQGAGYSTPPTLTFVNDPREGLNNVTQGFGAAAVATLTGAGTITGLLCIDHGLPQTSVPTLTFTGGGGSSAAATAVMCFTITAIAISATTAGSGYAAPVVISAYAQAPSGGVGTNPTTQQKLLKGRNAFIIGAVASAALTTAGTVIQDGGIYPAVPTVYTAAGGPYGSSSVQGLFLSPSVGGTTDLSQMTPI